MDCVLYTFLCGTFLQGHFVGRCFDKLLWRTRKWNGFLHLLCDVFSSTLRFFLFDVFCFLFSGAMSFQNLLFSCCRFFHMLKPAKNRVRLMSRRASSRQSWPDSLRSVLSWFGRMPKTPRNQGCWFALRINSAARRGMDLRFRGVLGVKTS